MHSRVYALIPVLLLTGCASLTQPTAENGCQIRGASLGGELGWDPFGQTAGEGGAATQVGACDDDKFHTFTRTPGGSIVCYGAGEWCENRAKDQPVSITPEQLRELISEPPTIE